MGSKDKKSSDEDSIIDWWNEKTNEQKGGMIIVVAAFIILLVIICSVASAPTVTALEITSPVSLTNTEVDQYYYKEYNITNTTKSVEIQGKSAVGAEVTAYVVYSSEFYNLYNLTDPKSSYYSGKIPEDFRNHSSGTKPVVSDAQKVGKSIKVPIDNTTGQFKFTVETNPDASGDTWIYLVATYPKAEQNVLELILKYPPGPIGPTSTETNTTTATTSAGDVSDYDRGYDDGYFSGVNDAYDESDYCNNPSTSSMFSDLWRDGFKLGYTHGYNDIKNGRSLETPKVPGAAILDPRTGQTIENTQ